MELSRHQIELLRQTDSPTVANVIELFDVRSYVAGYADGTLRAIYPGLPPAVGYAVTATFRAGYPSGADEAYGDMPSLIAAAQDIPEPRIIVFQDLDDPPRAATYGELMATAFKRFGFAGLITSGAARDIEQVRKLRFPCWASSVIVSHGYPRIVDVNLPVVAGGLQVKPGDLIHADGNGIIQIPNQIWEAVAELCGPYMDAERMVLDYLEAAGATIEGYRDAVARMKQVMADLRQRAKSYVE